MQQNFVFLVSQTDKDWIGEISVETEKNERPKVLVLYIDVVVKKKRGFDLIRLNVCWVLCWWFCVSMVYFHHFKRANTLKLNFMMLKVKAAFYECMIRPGSDAKLFMSLEPNSNYGRPKLFRPAELIQTPILIAAEVSSKGEKCSFRSNCLQKTL